MEIFYTPQERAGETDFLTKIFGVPRVYLASSKKLQFLSQKTLVSTGEFFWAGLLLLFMLNKITIQSCVMIVMRIRTLKERNVDKGPVILDLQRIHKPSQLNILMLSCRGIMYRALRRITSNRSEQGCCGVGLDRDPSTVTDILAGLAAKPMTFAT